MNNQSLEAIRPFVQECLLLQSLFLNFLWIILFWGWILHLRTAEKYSQKKGFPSFPHIILAFAVWILCMGVAILDFDPTFYFVGFAISNGVFLSVLNPNFAVCFTLTMLLMRPWEILADSAFIRALPRFSTLFTIGWAAFYFSVIDGFAIRLSRVYLMMVAYAIWVLASTVVTGNPADSINVFNDTMVRNLTMTYLITHLIRTPFGVWSLKSSLINIFTCVGLIALVFYFEGYREDGRIISFGMFSNTNDTAAVMSILLPLSASPFLFGRRSIITKIFTLFSMGVALLVMVLAQSRGTILSVVVTFALFLLLRIKRKVLAVTLISLVFIGGYGATKLFNRGEGDLEGSSTSRMSFLISGVRMAIYNPVFGVGFGQFPMLFETYALEITEEYGQRTAHNSWILALSEGGWVGLLLFGLVIFRGGVFRAYRLLKVDPSWLYAIAAYGTTITFLSHTYLLAPYLLVASIGVASQAHGVEP